MMFRCQQWIVTLVLCWFLGGMGVALAQTGGPTFYPKRNQAATMEREYPPVPEPTVPAGRSILGGESGYGGKYGPPDYPQYPYDQTPSFPSNDSHGLSPLLLSGDPVAVLPHAIDLANKYGIVQCLAVLLVVFIFQYVRNSQKSANQREEFLHQQLNYSEKRTTEELTRLSSKLGMMEQDLRALQDRFDRHAELIRANGQLCREIVSTMTAHNLAVEQGITELGAKLDTLTSAFRKMRKTKDEKK